MLGKASDTQSSTSLGGSGALSHVYIQHPPLRCSVPGSIGFFYDDGNKLLLSPTSVQVFAWKTDPVAPHGSPIVDSIDEGPVLSIRYSLDGKVMGIQRSKHEIQFKNRESGQSFTQRCRSESESILGFFWTDCPTCDVIIIKTSGLDLFSYEPELKALRLLETKRLTVSWYVYTHESRMVLLASGMQCNTFAGFQFSSGGVIRLPQFEMAMAKAEANTKPVLAEEDVNIVTVYGRIYCLQVDRVAMLLHLYRFYRDAVVRQGSLPMYSSKIAVSVIDNVLLIHQVEAKVVILYDIFSDSRAPISAPLPLLLRGTRRTNSASRSGGAVHAETNEVNDYEGIHYEDGWTFLVPNLICDVLHGNLWRIHLDLEAITASSSEVPSVLEFLQRRKLEASKAKQLCLAIARTLILERRPLSMVSRAIDVLISSYSHSLKMGSSHIEAVGGEKISTSGNHHLDEAKRIANESLSRVETHGSLSVVNKESRQSMSGYVENKSFNLNSSSTVNRSPSCSDSEENVDTERIANTSVSEIVRASSQGSPLDSDLSEQHEPQVASVAISPDEMYSFIFSPVEEEMVGEPAYLVAVLVEYFHSAASEKLKVHQNLNVMAVQLLARSERYVELGLFVVHKILEPSKEVALQLLESGRQNLQTRKLGMDMLRQLSLHHEYVLLLVQDGYYLEALRYARKTKVTSIRPSLYLEAAYASNDSQHVAAVLRFLSDFIPGFKNTTDHQTYYSILQDMSPSIVA